MTRRFFLFFGHLWCSKIWSICGVFYEENIAQMRRRPGVITHLQQKIQQQQVLKRRRGRGEPNCRGALPYSFIGKLHYRLLCLSLSETCFGSIKLFTCFFSVMESCFNIFFVSAAHYKNSCIYFLKSRETVFF